MTNLIDGPVLEPFLLKTLKADWRINPVLEPPPDDGKKPHLQWNMLWHSGSCRCTRDDRHVAWTRGRKEPATQPRVSSLRIISEHFPWPITVTAADKDAGVTCGEVIDGIDERLHRQINKADFKALDPARQRKVSEYYYRNREPGNAAVPGGYLESGMTTVDWLCDRTIFGGIRKDDRFVRKWFGDVLPGVLVLDCAQAYNPTEDERREMDARQAESERLGRHHSRRTPRPSRREQEQEEDERETERDEEETRGRSRTRPSVRSDHSTSPSLA
jgi:hypothetical protein